MATQPTSMNIIKQVLIRLSQKESIRSIASTLHISKNTVSRHKAISEADPMSVRELIALEDTILNHRFNGGNPAYCDDRMEVLKELLPELEKELKKPHVTSRLLWEEYRRKHPDGYGLSQFRFHISQHIKAVTPSTLLRDLYQPGQKMLIDFAGDRMSYVDTDTGEEVFVETYVAVMPFSGMTFILCVRSQGIEQFLTATVKALEFFGGVPKILVPDNLKSAVKRADPYEPDLTTGMNDLANHYLCVAQPARVRKPKDKALVEDAVNKAYRHIYAPLRNHVFQSLEELNDAVSELVDRYNQKRLTGCDYSRRECFLASEKTMLAPLPKAPFEFKRRASLKVAPNSFITFGPKRNSYSVPYRLIGQQVDVTFTATQVRIYHSDECVATHIRSYRHNDYTYVEEHLPPKSREYRAYSAGYFIAKAERISSDFRTIIEALFAGGQPEQVYFRTSQGFFSLQRNSDPSLFLQACAIAVSHGNLRYKFVQALVKSQCEGFRENADELAPPSGHSNIRGKAAFV